jgi:hypothetical protein
MPRFGPFDPIDALEACPRIGEWPRSVDHGRQDHHPHDERDPEQQARERETFGARDETGRKGDDQPCHPYRSEDRDERVGRSGARYPAFGSVLTDIGGQGSDQEGSSHRCGRADRVEPCGYR